ncbi:MAG: phosphatidate cytidylyltransferase [Bacteroidota bacterium]
MLPEVYTILLVYFLIGGFGVFLINLKEKETTLIRERWLKYLVYLVTVNIVLLSIHFGYFLYLSFLLVAVGLYEIIRVGYRKVTSLTFAVCIYGLVSTLFILSYSLETDILLLIYFLILTFDGFSQIIGQLAGKNKLTPKISPNKTFEGLLGGVLSVIVTLFIWFPPENFLVIVLCTFFGALISVIAFCGDLLASFYKRINEVKDFSKLIPGHGGVLDRFDSFIFTLGILSFFLTYLFNYGVFD